MKSCTLFLATLLLFMASHGLAQSGPQADLLSSSSKIFRLEVENKIDSLEQILDDKLIVLNSAGETQTKSQYLARLRSGNFQHDVIKVEDNTAVITGNTGVVTGKGTFTITAGGKQSVLHLAYLETFTRDNVHTAWKLLALHASVIPAIQK